MMTIIPHAPATHALRVSLLARPVGVAPGNSCTVRVLEEGVAVCPLRRLRHQPVEAIAHAQTSTCHDESHFGTAGHFGAAPHAQELVLSHFECHLLTQLRDPRFLLIDEVFAWVAVGEPYRWFRVGRTDHSHACRGPHTIWRWLDAPRIAHIGRQYQKLIVVDRLLAPVEGDTCDALAHDELARFAIGRAHHEHAIGRLDSTLWHEHTILNFGGTLPKVHGRRPKWWHEHPLLLVRDAGLLLLDDEEFALGLFERHHLARVRYTTARLVGDVLARVALGEAICIGRPHHRHPRARPRQGRKAWPGQCEDHSPARTRARPKSEELVLVHVDLLTMQGDSCFSAPAVELAHLTGRRPDDKHALRCPDGAVWRLHAADR